MARRRSSDIPNSSAALAFASSNATLNAFLGGRQRPWMQGRGLSPPGENGLNQQMPPPRPLATPPKVDGNEPSLPTPPALAINQPPTPNTSTRTNRHTSTAAARNEASPSTSPALANMQPPCSILPPHTSASTNRTSFDILPSPTPSDDCNRVDNPVGRAEVDIFRDQGVVPPNPPPAQALSQVLPQAPVSATAQLQPTNSETALKRPTHVNMQHPHKRLRTEDSTPAANSTLPTIAQGTDVAIRRSASSH